MASALELLLLARMAGVPVARAYATAITTAITTPKQVTLAATSFDNLSGFNASGTYTVQAAGTYRVYGNVSFAATNSNWAYAAIYKNGSALAVGPSINPTTTAGYGANVEDLVQCVVGDTLALYAASQASIATANPQGGSVDCFLNVSLVSWT